MSILRDKSVLHVSRLKLGVHRHWPNPRTENINHWFDSGIIRIAHINQSSMQPTWKRDDVYLFLDQATGSPDPTQSNEKHSLLSHPPNTIMESHTQKPCGHNWVHYISFSARFFIVLSCPNKVFALVNASSRIFVSCRCLLLAVWYSNDLLKFSGSNSRIRCMLQECCTVHSCRPPLYHSTFRISNPSWL